MSNFHEWRVLAADGREYEVVALDKEGAKAKVNLATNGRVEIVAVHRVK